jgi:hypothetical protein
MVEASKVEALLMYLQMHSISMRLLEWTSEISNTTHTTIFKAAIGL